MDPNTPRDRSTHAPHRSSRPRSRHLPSRYYLHSPLPVPHRVPLAPNNTPQTSTQLTLPRRHRLHRRRHRRLRSRIPPVRHPGPSQKRLLSPSHLKRHPPHRCRLHQLGRRPGRRAPTDRPLQACSRVVLRAIFAGGSGELDAQVQS